MFVCVCMIKNKNILSEYARKRVYCVPWGCLARKISITKLKVCSTIWEPSGTEGQASSLLTPTSMEVSRWAHHITGHKVTLKETSREKKRKKCFVARCLTTDIKSCLHIIDKNQDLIEMQGPIEEETGVTSFRSESGQNEVYLELVSGVESELSGKVLSSDWLTASNYHWTMVMM